MTTTFVFDLETIPDIKAGRTIHGLEDVPDEDVVRALQHLQYQKSGSDFLPLHLHRVVTISWVVEKISHDETSIRVGTLGEPELDEAEIVAKFFQGVDKTEPRLVSWNGMGFDLPVLNYRALLHGVQAPVYWEQGERRREYRYANYQNRYHHGKNLDLMDRLSRSQRGAPLNDISRMLGLPGKPGMRGGDVYDAWRQGRIEEIRAYCESDALNTYLIYLRYERMCGNLSREDLDARCTILKDYLAGSDKPHLAGFLRAWNEAGGASRASA